MRSFYWYFRPIAIFFKILGIFPLDNVSSSDVSKIKFRVKSSAHFYSFFILSSFCVMVYLFYGFVVSLKSYTEIIKSFVIWGMIGRSLACFVVYGLKNFHGLPLLIQLLDNFDKQKEHILLDDRKRSITKMCVWTIVPSILMIIILITTLYLCSSLILSILPQLITVTKYETLFSYVFAYLMSRDLYSFLLYIYFAHFINHGYIIINNTLVGKGIVPNYYRDINYPSDLYEILSQIHSLHRTLAKCVSQLGKVFGTFMAINQFAVILVLVINISVYISLHTYYSHLLMLTIINAVLVVWTLCVSHEIKKNVSLSLH